MGIFIHRYLPKTFSDFAAFSFLIFAIHTIGFYELLVVLPSTSKPHINQFGNSFLGYYFHVLVGFFLYFNAIYSLYKVITTNSSIKGLILPSILKPGWRFCYVCECNVPPRSFHCHICNTCILKRDHHCTFTGCCVGHTNQRYYISLLFNCAAAGIYSTCLNMDFFYHIFGSVSWKTIVTIVFPLISWMFVHNDHITAAQAFVSSLCLIGFCLSSGLLLYHISNILKGQIVHERTYGNKAYDLGWKENFKQVFGSRWRIAWLSPFVPSPLPGDGIEFMIKNDFENSKEL